MNIGNGVLLGSVSLPPIWKKFEERREYKEKSFTMGSPIFGGGVSEFLRVVSYFTLKIEKLRVISDCFLAQKTPLNT